MSPWGLALTHWPRGFWLLSRLITHPGDITAATNATVHLNAPVLPRIVARLRADAEGRDVLREKPLLDRRGVDYDALAQLAPGTLGRAYADFLNAGGYDPDAHRELPSGFAGDAGYMGLRLRQCHDLWHVVTGIGTDLWGEIEIQAFTCGQLHTPSAFFLGFIGALRWWPWHGAIMRRVFAAYRRGKRAAYLAPVYWERHFETPLAEMRAEMRL